MAMDNDAQGMALMAARNAAWALARNRLVSARERAMARNPRLLPPATNNAGTYTLADGSTVTVACSTSAPAGASFFPAPSSRTLADYDNIVLTEGGYRAIAYNGHIFAAGAKTVASNAWDNPAGKADVAGRYTTETNAPAITFIVMSGGAGGNKKMRFLVNGQYISLAGHALASTDSTAQFFTLTFSDSRTRSITLEAQCRFLLQRILLVQGSNYYALNRPAGQKPRLMVVADSYGVGPALATGIQSDETLTMQGDGLYQQAADWLGCDGILNAIGGTGFSNGTAGQWYQQRWQDVLDVHGQNPIDALHIHGSVNDVYSSVSVATTQAATTAYLVQAVAALPNIPITLSGCFPLSGMYNAKAVQLEAAFSAAVDAAVAQTGSTRLKFIPVQTPSYIPTWPASGGSSLIAYDGVHLQPGVGGGHEACGRRMASDIYGAWLSMA